MGRILLSICAVVVAGAVAGSAETRQPQPQSGQGRPDAASDQSQPPTFQQRENKTEAEKAAAAEKREEDDLRAQQRMALAAEAQAADVDAQTALFALSVILSALASVVSVGALMVAMGTGRRELRAYLMVEGILPLHPTMASDYKRKRPKPPDIPAVIINVKNFGPTPATQVLHWAEFQYRDASEESTLTVPASLDRVSESAAAPGVPLTKTIPLTHPVTPAQADKIRDGTGGLYVWGVCVYRDAFKRRRKTTYRLRYSGPWPWVREATFTFCNEGNHVE